MLTTPATDLAQRVQKFFYSRALLCEHMHVHNISVASTELDLPPSDYDPFASFFVDTRVLSCAMIDGLSSLWKILAAPNLPDGNQVRFVTFLLEVGAHRDLPRVATPLLCHFLATAGLEELFQAELKRQWVCRETEYQSHQVFRDPLPDELRQLYRAVNQRNSSSSVKLVKNIDTVLRKFTYAGLIYKFYRTAFVHGYRASKYVSGYSRGEEISVRQFRDEKSPQLDVGLGVLTKAIRHGADLVASIIDRQGRTEIPDDPDDEIKL
jgi:hypothetical protein